MLRIGLSTAAFYGALETEDAAKRVADMGLPCCEVFLETRSEYTKAFGQLTKERLGSTQAVSVHCKTQHFEGDFIGLSSRQREDAFAAYEGFLQAGEALGAGIYVFHGPAKYRQGPVPDFSRWKDGIQKAIDMAKAHGISLCYETVCWCWLNEPARVSQFLSLWPELLFVLDAKQVQELGQNPIDYIDRMGDALRHIHILDFDDAGRAVLPGLGRNDFRDLARALRANGYKGDIILEPYGNTARDAQALEDSIKWLRDTFGAQ